MESHIVAVDGKAVLHQSLTISFDSGLCDEIANPENHGKVDQVAQLAGELFSPFGAVDVSDLADDGTVTEKFKPLVSLDEAFALACYRDAVGCLTPSNNEEDLQLSEIVLLLAIAQEVKEKLCRRRAMSPSVIPSSSKSANPSKVSI